MESRDYYEILGVSKDADNSRIKNAYRKLAFQYHPDRNTENPEAAEKMKWINEAYAVLSNPQRRIEYDRMRSRFGAGAHNRFRQTYSNQDMYRESDIHEIFDQMAQRFGFRNFEEIFREMAEDQNGKFHYGRPGMDIKGFFFTGRIFPGAKGQKNNKPLLGGAVNKASEFLLKKLVGDRFPRPGADISDIITLSQEHAENGGPYAYHVKPLDKKLVVHVPRGMKEGKVIRLENMGKPGAAGGPPGHLYLKVHIKKPVSRRIREAIGGWMKK